MLRPLQILRTLHAMFDLRYLNAGSTVRSSIGFMRTLLRSEPGAITLEQIFNYLPISERIASAGQPSPQQFPAIARAGFQTVINLAPHEAENAIPDERQLVEALGMTYVHIPVNFQQPTETDFECFVRAMKDAQDNPVFVHCAANMRVSAFLYRYRTRVQCEAEATARKDLEQIWKPFGAWAEFIRQ